MSIGHELLPQDCGRAAEFIKTFPHQDSICGYIVSFLDVADEDTGILSYGLYLTPSMHPESFVRTGDCAFIKFYSPEPRTKYALALLGGLAAAGIPCNPHTIETDFCRIKDGRRESFKRGQWTEA